MNEYYVVLFLLFSGIKSTCAKSAYPRGRISRVGRLNGQYFQKIANIVSSEDLTGMRLKQLKSAEFYCSLNADGLAQGLNSTNLSFSTVISYYEGVIYANSFNAFQGVSAELADSNIEVWRAKLCIHVHMCRAVDHFHTFSPKFIQIVNETTIVMRIDRVSIINAMLDCKLNNTVLLDEYRIYLGHRWMMSYGCVSMKWEEMYCELHQYSLTYPSTSDILVQYGFSSVPNIRVNAVNTECNSHPQNS